ncbi:hypothetical protein FW764_21330 [Pseudomonas sp. 1152_12]
MNNPALVTRAPRVRAAGDFFSCQLPGCQNFHVGLWIYRGGGSSFGRSGCGERARHNPTINSALNHPTRYSPARGSQTRQNVIPVYQGDAAMPCDTESVNDCQIPAKLFGIPNDTIRNIRLSERNPLHAANHPENHHKFHAVVVIFVTRQLAYILLYPCFW